MSSRGWPRVAFGAHYTSLYRHRDEAEARRCVALIDRLRPLAGRRVLDLGCGAGRHLPALAELGARGEAVDLSADLLAELRASGRGRLGFGVLRGDWSHLPLRDGVYDLVASLFTAFGYGEHPKTQVAVTAEIARVLKPGGAWLLDYLNPRRVRAELAAAPPAREREVDGCRITETRTLSDDGGRVEKTVAIEPLFSARLPGIPDEGLTYTESVALIDLPELDALASAAGLHRREAAGDYAGAAFDPDASPRWLLLFVREDAS